MATVRTGWSVTLASALSALPRRPEKRGEEEGHTDGPLNDVVDLRGIGELLQGPDRREGCRNRTDDQPADQAKVHRALLQVDATTDGLHHHRGHEIARHRLQRRDLEDEHEDRRHEGPAAHPGEPDDEADTQPGQRQHPVDVHPNPPGRPGADRTFPTDLVVKVGIARGGVKGQFPGSACTFLLGEGLVPWEGA
jgi:hypothetical protein